MLPYEPLYGGLLVTIFVHVTAVQPARCNTFSEKRSTKMTYIVTTVADGISEIGSQSSIPHINDYFMQSFYI